jgi:hypothetical protein
MMLFNLEKIFGICTGRIANATGVRSDVGFSYSAHP